MCNLTHEFYDILWHSTKIYSPKVFLLIKINPEYCDILYNPTHFSDPLVCWIRQVPLLNQKGVKIRLVSFPTQCSVFIICFFLSIQCYIDINVSVSLQILLFLCHAKKNIGRHLHLIKIHVFQSAFKTASFSVVLWWLIITMVIITMVIRLLKEPMKLKFIG